MTIARVLDRAGVEIGGAAPHDIKLHDRAALRAYALRGMLGASDAYVAGQWDSDRLDELVFRLLRANDSFGESSWWRAALGAVVNAQAGRRGFAVARHYDLGNDLFEAMLDPRMIYSCAYWEGAETLAAAQEQKLDLVCRKLGLARGMRLLDVGGGWGGLAKFAAERYGVRAVVTTISREQAEYAKAACRGLPIEIRVQDYRAMGADHFDAVASIGMFEHVGHKNYRRFFEVVRDQLAPHALFLLHSIGGATSRTTYDPWFEQNIFPGTHIPSARQITGASEGLFHVEDWQDIGLHYDRTLLAWHDNFERAWPRLRDKYGERFYRTWRYYLLVSAGAFRARHLHTWQVVFAATGRLDGYRASR